MLFIAFILGGQTNTNSKINIFETQLSIQENIVQHEKVKLQNFMDKICKVLPEGAWLEKQHNKQENHAPAVKSILEGINENN
tara:strand:- start:5134 stop:5379 length:246 start_codon:yes stop_codon:yes gene_type:complete